MPRKYTSNSGPQASGYLGGDVSMAERYRLRDKHITPLACKAVDFGWRDQCRCGETKYAKWRGRWYCIRCARWVRVLHPMRSMGPRTELAPTTGKPTRRRGWSWLVNKCPLVTE
jgi:hypothetical protein